MPPGNFADDPESHSPPQWPLFWSRGHSSLIPEPSGSKQSAYGFYGSAEISTYSQQFCWKSTLTDRVSARLDIAVHESIHV